MVVVMAVFLFIIGAAMGIFISIVQHQKRVLAQQQLVNQIGYVEEYMSKALRMADTDSIKTDPSSNCITQGLIYQLMTPVSGVYTGIEFLNASESDICQEFFLDTNGILKETKTTATGTTTVPLTSPNVQITSVRFSVNGKDGSVAGQGCSGDPCGALANTVSNPTLQPQPRVTILLNMSIPGEDTNNICDGTCPCDSSTNKCLVQRTIQTTVSRRNLNVVQP